MARAKNTTRAEARRRSRAESRAELDAARLDEHVDEPADAPAAPVAAERRPGFRLPNFRQDLRDLPRILTSRRAMIIPPAMLIAGFVLQLVVIAGALPTALGIPMPLAENGWMSFAEVAALYVQVFFFPPALLTFFLAGYLAPRASYLVGALYGLLAGLMWAVLVFATPLPILDGAEGIDRPSAAGYFLLLNLAYGTFAAAFAAWYRDFLRRMRDQGMARRADREAQERAKRREQRHEDRRAVKRTGR